MKLTQLLSLAALCAAVSVAASAEEISYFTATITSSSPTQLGRPSRNGQPQTWTGIEAYPGVLASTTGTTYNYATYSFAASLFAGAPYVEISAYDPAGSGGNVFVSAYANSYNPSSRATNWLGDAGSSENLFTTNATAFDVVLPVGSNLVLVLNTTSSLGLNDPQLIDVSAYADTMYDDPTTTPPVTATPEPSSFITLGTGLLGLAGVVRRRVRS